MLENAVLTCSSGISPVYLAVITAELCPISHGDAEYVRTLHARGIHNGGRIRSHQRDGIDAWRDIALAHTTFIESDGAITVGENRAAAMPHVGGIAKASDEQ